MNRLLRIAFAGFFLIIVLGWMIRRLGEGNLGGGVDGGLEASPRAVYAVGALLVLGLVARGLGLGSCMSPEQRRREARQRTSVRRPVELEDEGIEGSYTALPDDLAGEDEDR